MGNNSSRGMEQASIQINHPKFVNCTVLHELGKQVLRTRLTCDQKAYEAWNEHLQKHKNLTHEYLLLPESYRYQSSGMCTTRGSVEIDFDNYPYLLTDEIHHRKIKRVPFTEPELWYLLYAYLSVKNFLTLNASEYPHNLIGDIRPHNVFINSNGQVKFSSLFSWPSEKTNYSKTFDGTTTYLSPEDCQLLQMGSTNNQPNYKSQFFSIGFTLLSTAILQDNTDVYNIQKQHFDQFQATKRINSFKCLAIYSELLRAVVSSLCTFDVHRRIELHDLWVWITRYERRIMKKQPFMIDEVPPKINDYINILRTEVSSLEPSSSVLNLNSIKSLKGSQAKNRIEASESPEIRFLKKVEKGSEIDKQYSKRRSRIVINTGRDERIFYSPTEGAYFTSQVAQNSRISEVQAQISKQGSKIMSFYSPPIRQQGERIKYESKRLVKSPQGFYSSKGTNNFRVFIQYKSPPRPSQNRQTQAVPIQARGQEKAIIQRVEEQKKIRKQSESNSQKSGGSNRQNRFIQSTINTQPIQVRQIQTSETSNQKTVISINPKNSPIHQIQTSEEVVHHGISQVVSEEIIMIPVNPVNKYIHQFSENGLKNVKETDFKITFDIRENLSQTGSNLVNGDVFYGEKVLEVNSRAPELSGSITSQILENFHGLSPVKRQSTKKMSLHDSKRFEQQLSRDKDLKRIENSLEESDIQRHIIEEEIYEMTRDEGRNVVLPSRQSVESDSMKFQIPERIGVESHHEVLKHHAHHAPSYGEMLTQIFPVERGSVQKKKTLSELQVEKHNRNQSEIQRKLNQMQQSDSQVQQALKSANDDGAEQITFVERVSQMIPLESGFNENPAAEIIKTEIAFDSIQQNRVTIEDVASQNQLEQTYLAEVKKSSEQLLPQLDTFEVQNKKLFPCKPQIQETEVGTRIEENRDLQKNNGGSLEALNADHQVTEEKVDSLKNIQMEVLEMANEIIEMQQNFNVDHLASNQPLPPHHQFLNSGQSPVQRQIHTVKQNPTLNKIDLVEIESISQQNLQNQGVEQFPVIEYVYTEQIIEHEISSEKERSDLMHLQTPEQHHQTIASPIDIHYQNNAGNTVEAIASPIDIHYQTNTGNILILEELQNQIIQDQLQENLPISRTGDFYHQLQSANHQDADKIYNPISTPLIVQNTAALQQSSHNFLPEVTQQTPTQIIQHQSLQITTYIPPQIIQPFQISILQNTQNVQIQHLKEKLQSISPQFKINTEKTEIIDHQNISFQLNKEKLKNYQPQLKSQHQADEADHQLEAIEKHAENEVAHQLEAIENHAEKEVTHHFEAIGEYLKNQKSQVQQMQQQISDFHSSQIESILPFEQRKIEVDQQYAKPNTEDHKLQKGNAATLEDIEGVQKEWRQVVQQVTEVELNPSQTITSYKTVEYEQEDEMGEQNNSERIVYNIFQVNDRSSPGQNRVIDDSEIQGSGKLHSRIVYESSQEVTVELPTDQSASIQHHLTESPVLQSSPQKSGENSIQRKTIKSSVYFYEDSFLKEIQLTNEKLCSIINHQQETEKGEVLLYKTRQQIPSPSLENLNHASTASPNNIKNSRRGHTLNDPFLTDVFETNKRLGNLQKKSQDLKLPSHQLKNQMGTYAHSVQISSAEIQIYQATNQKYLGGSLKSQLEQSIQNSLIEFDTVKQVLGQSKYLGKYQIVHEESPIQQFHSFNEHIQTLPIQSNSNNQPSTHAQLVSNPPPYQGELIDQLKTSFNHLQPQISLSSPHNQILPAHFLDQIEIASHLPQELPNQIPNQTSVQQNCLQQTHLQLSMPQEPTESQFGNISQIMDINKVFNNTLNGKQLNFLTGTNDPKTQQFLNEFIQLTQKSPLPGVDLSRVKMKIEDRDKLAKFMKKWQEMNPQDQSNINECMDQFRQAITHSQLNLPSIETQQAKIRMSAQDKQTLRILVSKINGSNIQENINPSENIFPANYDQSCVNVECSDLRTDAAVIIEKADPVLQEKSSPKIQQTIKLEGTLDTAVIDVLAGGFKSIEQKLDILTKDYQIAPKKDDILDFQSSQPKRSSKVDIVTQITDINKILKTEQQSSNDISPL